FTGVTASEAPVLCDLCYATFATNAPATNSTSLTRSVRQIYSRSVTHGVTTARHWTSEPTELTLFAQFPLSPSGGTLLYAFPRGDTPDCAPEHGFVLRLTAAATVSVRASMVWERC